MSEKRTWRWGPSDPTQPGMRHTLWVEFAHGRFGTLWCRASDGEEMDEMPLNPRDLDSWVVRGLGTQFADFCLTLHDLGVGVVVHCDEDKDQQWGRYERVARGRE